MTVAQTSMDVFRRGRTTSTAKLQCDRIADYVARSGTATIAEIAQALRIEKSSVSARRSELIAAKRLELAEERKCSATGRWVQSVRAVPAPERLMQ
ncbi:MarR family transcriptional regulator (plasmid) [Ralstonia sp. 25C]|uniref:MarR family transcriptional regulator n=1 Tax=Ralstonia sp. 25C TaxID=3447363 RepID=UPI003F74C445